MQRSNILLSNFTLILKKYQTLLILIITLLCILVGLAIRSDNVLKSLFDKRLIERFRILIVG